ncbi:MAG: prohead protease [Proteobacteria bacterium]|nr:MAG: prohead protease [Pseudomonadota bacterium]PIE65430.1 MAG: prohead protease [Desulfobacterales bacterium]
MRVIVTHINADFDGMASMIAAQKLYPDAVMVFPGSPNKSLRDFISQTLLYRYDFLKAKQIIPEKITSLIVVDTRSSKRIGSLAACLKNKGLEIHLYDHHPKAVGDLHGNVEVVRDVGSTTTLMTELLQKKGIDITEEEATILGLGIYQDTGSLTHLTTTPEDLRAAAWLLEQGAKLNIISQFVSHDLTSHQVTYLNELIKNTNKIIIQNIPVVIAVLSVDEYIDDFSLIVRRLMTMENMDVLFALVSMAARTCLIARSRIPEVNVGVIARDFGGGGHTTAASATMKEMSLVEAQENLVQSLHRHIRPQAIAREMMTSPAITIPENASLNNAKALMTRYNINTMPVVTSLPDQEPAAGQTPQISGIISRQMVERAISHELGELPVCEYMSSDVKVLTPDATLADIQELIIENRQRLIPIMYDGKIKGIITRTDLLNKLVNDPANLPRNLLHESNYPSLERSRNISSLMVNGLNREIIVLLQKVGEIADEFMFSAFVVGGFVRDLLMKKANMDLDIVVEGEGIVFAKKLAKTLGGRVKTHERFKTATITLPDGLKLDIATARLEYYEYPAALPTVELSSIKLDLYRRDFTVNAMAIQLNPEHFGTLIDFFNSQNDLKNRSIKVLHNLSFVDDPTRIFRAIRFETRMEFTIVKHTQRLIHNAVKMALFGKASDPRFFLELKILLNEENAIPPIKRLAELGLFPFLWPDLKPHLHIDRRCHHCLLQAQRAISWFKLLYLPDAYEAWIIYLLTIMSRSPVPVLNNFCNRFQIARKQKEILIHEKTVTDKTAHFLARRPGLKNSEIYMLLSELRIEGLLYLMAIARKTDVKRMISSYVTSMRQERPLLNGNDLKELGYQPGPLFKEILHALVLARIDHMITSREEEIAFVQNSFPRPEKR